MNFDHTAFLPAILDIPLFYQEVIIGFNKSKQVSTISSRDEILNSMIWGNIHFTYKVKNKSYVLHLPNWEKAGLLRMIDIKVTNGKLDQNYLISKLKDRRNIYQEFKIFHLAVKPYLHIIHSNNPTTPVRSVTLPFFKQKNNTINIENVKSKFFYSNILANRKAHIPISEVFWRNKLGNTSIDFPKCYFSRIKLLKDHKLAEFNVK